MCDLGGLSLGLTALGGASSAIGAAGEAEITRSNYLYNAAVGEFDAKMAEVRIQDTIERGRFAEQEVARGAKTTKGAQIADIAGSGVTISGSALDILSGIDVVEAVDQGIVQENTRKAVFADEVAALDARTGAAFDRASARGIDPAIAAGTSLINTAGQVASRWYNQRRAETGAKE